MVTTRSQASKKKAHQSPETSAEKVSKLPRKQRAASVAATDLLQAAAERKQARGAAAAKAARPLADKKLNAAKEAGDMGAKQSKGVQPGGCAAWPSSHPIASLPGSPTGGQEAPGAADFFIPAVQQLQMLAAEQAAATQAAGEAAAQQQSPVAPAVSVGPVEPLAEQQPAAADGVPTAAAPDQEQTKVQQQQQEEQQQQHAQPPAPALQPRPEKLLKPLPDKPVPCDKLPDGPEPVQVDVEYVATQDLQPVEEPAAAVAAVLPGLQAADWLEAVKALNLLRQLVAHHPETFTSQLDQLVPLVLKSVRSLRSSVCKTAIMAVADLYQRYGDALLPHTDVGGQLKPMTSMLAQILLKCSSNDKKFVIEEAQRALQTMVASLSPAECLRVLLPYADQHKNPKVRGKAGGAVAEAVARMQPQDMLAFGMPRLLQVASKLVTDNTPDARDSAKKVIGLLKAGFADPAVEAELAAPVAADAPAAAAAEGEEPARQPTKWEAFCQANLSGSAALKAVLKACSE